MKKVWFISDTLFGSERARLFYKRPFATTKIMDEAMITNWNEAVGEDDIIYHLGDFGNLDIAKRLNGRVFMLCGDMEMQYAGCGIDDFADYLSTVKETKEYALKQSVCVKMAEIARNGFHAIWYNDKEPRTVAHLKKLTGHRVRMVHKPEHRNVTEFTVFGHGYENPVTMNNAMNVGVDAHKFYPVSLETVLLYKEGIKNGYKNDSFYYKED